VVLTDYNPNHTTPKTWEYEATDFTIDSHDRLSVLDGSVVVVVFGAGHWSRVERLKKTGDCQCKKEPSNVKAVDLNALIEEKLNSAFDKLMKACGEKKR
jgi:hypothetical protein